MDSIREQIIRIAEHIHDNPELGYAEFKASKLLTSVLEENGFGMEMEGLTRRGVATDVGDVSQVVPSIYPFVAIGPTRDPLAFKRIRYRSIVASSVCSCDKHCQSFWYDGNRYLLKFRPG